MKYIKKFAFVIASAVLLAACSAPGAQNQEAEATTRSSKIAVETQKPIRGALALDGEFLGTIMPGEMINIVSPVVGIVESIAIQEGDYVNEGDVLFRLDDDSVQAQLDKALVGYESSIISKEQALFNANNTLTNTQFSHDQLLITQSQSLFNSDNSVINAENSVEKLELAKEQAVKQAQDMITNAEATYQSTLTTKNQALEGGSQELADLQTDKAIQDLEDAIKDAKDKSQDSLIALSDAEEATLQQYMDAKDVVAAYPAEKAEMDQKITAVGTALGVTNKYALNQESFAELVTIATTTSPQLDLTATAKTEILAANASLQSSGLSAAQATNSMQSSLASSLERLTKTYETTLANVPAYQAAYEKAYDAYDAARDTADDAVDDLEKQLEHQQAVVDIQNGQVKEDTIQTLDEQLERARTAVEQAKKSLELTIESYDMQIQQAREAQDTALTSGGYTQDSLQGQLNQSANSLETSKQSIAILENVYDSQIESAYLGIESAQLQLDQYTVESPLNGVIENITLVEEGMVSNSSVVATISDYSTMEVVFYVGEAVKNEIKIGQTLTFELEGKYYEGQVNEVSNSVDQSTRLFKITALVDPEEEKFSNGVTVRITTGTFEEEQTIIVPYDSVIFSNGTSYVFKVVDGVAVRQEVEVGLFTEDSIAVLSGLTEEDEVITTWAEGLRDGVDVDIISSTEEGVDTAEVENENN